MKTKFMVLAGIALFVAITSCSKDDGITYSCDKEVDRWVKKNLDEIKEMTTVEFLEFSDVAVQKGVWAAFSIEQKQKVWFDKIENLLQLDWTEKEREHIESLLSYIKRSEFYGPKDDVVKEQVYLAAYKWQEYAKEELGWSDRVIYAVAFTPNKVYKKDNILQVQIESRQKQPLVKRLPECECHNGNTFNEFPDCWKYSNDLHTWEPSQYCRYLANGGCLANYDGCGFAGLLECNGLC